jgi:hypothetical protein
MTAAVPHHLGSNNMMINSTSHILQGMGGAGTGIGASGYRVGGSRPHLHSLIQRDMSNSPYQQQHVKKKT